MYKRWQTAIIVLLLGFAVPGLMLSRISKLNQVGSNSTTTPETECLQTTQTEVTANNAISISILDHNGNVTIMNLEEYVACVVLAEMPASFEVEALKAQAVVARTYTLRRIEGNPKHKNAAVCKKPSCCQSFCSFSDYITKGGKQENAHKVIQAVKDTEGLVLVYDSELIEATYFSCSGGVTEDAAAAWGEDIPYLQSTVSPGEEAALNYVRTVFFTVDEFADRLDLENPADPGNWIGKITYTAGQGVDSIEIGGKLYKGTQLRSKLDLYSTAFIITIVGDTVVITTRGYGHRVGMSQYGADAMAVKGSSFVEILSHYYKNTELVNYACNFISGN